MTETTPAAPPQKMLSARRIWLRRFAFWFRDLWAVLGLAGLLFVAASALAQCFWSQHDPSDLVRWPVFRAASQPRDERFWRALEADVRATHDTPTAGRRLAWHPQVYWRSCPHAGELIQVDADGLRRTVAPQARSLPNSSERPRQVWCFGGSTMWGTGVADADTIPSLLAAQLAGRGVAVDVTNFGQMGYVSAQHLMTLLESLRAGHRPDLVLFYDGYNDIWSSVVNGQPGLAVDEFERGAADELLRRPRLLTLLRHYAAASPLVAAWSPGREARLNERLGQQWAEAEAPDAIRAAIEVYLEHLRLCEAWAREYGFEARFYLQPLVYLRRRPTGEEPKIIDAQRGSTEAYRAAYRQAEDALRRGQPGTSRLAVLADVFDDPECNAQTFFYDACHVGDLGNRRIAARIADDVRELLTQSAEEE